MIAVNFDWKFKTPGDVCPEHIKKQFISFEQEWTAYFKLRGGTIYTCNGHEDNAVNTIAAVKYMFNKYSMVIDEMQIKTIELVEYKELGTIK